MESRKEKHDRRLSKLENHLASAEDASKYSLERFDILIISLSTSALILSIGFVNNIIPDLKNVNTCLLNTSWILFVVALLSNLISQVFGYYANETAITVTTNKIREKRDKPIMVNIEQKERNERRLSRIVLVLNGVSLLSLFIGIITLVWFFSCNI